MLDLLSALSAATPVAVVAFIALTIIGLLGWTLRVVLGQRRELTTIRTNDLHVLSDILEALQRIEREQAAAFATIIARLNGK